MNDHDCKKHGHEFMLYRMKGLDFEPTGRCTACEDSMLEEKKKGKEHINKQSDWTFESDSMINNKKHAKWPKYSI